MKQFFTLFIYFLLTISLCFTQQINVNCLFDKDLSDKYTRYEAKWANKKSFVFIPKPNLLNNKAPKIAFIVMQNKNKPLFPVYKNKKIRIFIRSGQRLNKALSFSGKAFLAEIPAKLPFLPFTSSENISEIDNPSFFKMTIKNLKVPENRIGVYTNSIMRNDTRRLSSIVSNNIDSRLRPYSAINQRNIIVLLGVNITL